MSNKTIKYSFFLGLTISVASIVLTYLTRYHDFTVVPLLLLCVVAPGPIFSALISKDKKTTGSTKRVSFITVSTIVFIITLSINIYYSIQTRGIITLFTSILTSYLIISFFKWTFDIKSKDAKPTVIAVVSGLFSATIVLTLYFIINSNLLHIEESRKYYYELIIPYLIFPFWFSGFAYSIKLVDLNEISK